MVNNLKIFQGSKWPKSCNRCHLKHNVGQYRAVNATCWACQKRGHYSSICRQRNVFQVSINSQANLNEENKVSMMAELNSLQVDVLYWLNRGNKRSESEQSLNSRPLEDNSNAPGLKVFELRLQTMLESKLVTFNSILENLVSSMQGKLVNKANDTTIDSNIDSGSSHESL